MKGEITSRGPFKHKIVLLVILQELKLRSSRLSQNQKFLDDKIADAKFREIQK